MRAVDRLFAAVAGAVLGVAAGLAVIAATGVPPLEAAGALADAAFGSATRIEATINNTVPLLLVGLGAAVALQAGLFNLGGDGQILVAVLAAVVAGVALDGLPAPLLWAAVLAAAVAGGAAWGGLAGLLRAYRGVSEVVSTIMLNFVAIALVAYLARGPLLAPTSAFPQTRPLPDVLAFPSAGPVSLAVALALAVAGAAWLVLYRTGIGLDLRAAGRNPRAAAVAGVAVARTRALALTVAGLLCGIAGLVSLIDVQRSVTPDFSPGFGFSGLMVALLGAMHPLGVVPAALFVGTLQTAGPALERELGVPGATVLIMEAGATLTAVALPHLIARRRRRVDA